LALSYIALGSNLAGRFADPAAAVEAAMRTLERSDIKVIARSRLYRSIAWPDPADPEFINAVAAIQTDLPPADLLDRLHATEAEFGRVRRFPNAPRPLDLDIIDYDGLTSAPGAAPILPHPRMADRAFVLLPLAEIAPDWRHPMTGAGIADLVRALPDPTGVTPL
jgi:2-amino-4-hydroxy-6-hydroxymethyldihydropteridine diphosphokinase